MEEAFSVKEQDFTIIKEKIIKTNDLIVLYKEANDKLTKSKSRANQAIKQLKEKNEALTQEVSTLKFQNERLTDNLERCKVDVKDLELTNLNDEFVKIQEKYQQHLIDSQLTITDLQSRIKECSCETNITPLNTSRKVTVHDKVRELKLLCNKFKESEQKLKSEINSLNKKNYNLEGKILILGNTKTPRCTEKKFATIKAQLQEAEASLKNHQQTIESLKQQHSNEISLLQEQLNSLILDNDKLKSLEEKCVSLEGELFRLQRRKKNDVYTQTENAPIGRCEGNSDDDEDLKDIFSEMICYKLMLSPMSGSGLSMSEEVAPIAVTSQEVLRNEIPNIIITPPTPSIDIKEGSLALHAIMQTTMNNAVPLDHCLNEMAIDFGDKLRPTDVQVKNSVTIPVSLEGSSENTSNKMAIYFGDDLKIVDAEVDSQINSTPKQKSLKRSIKSDRRRKKFWAPYPANAPLKTKRKNRPRDTILSAIQILQKNNINFTITNESPYNRLPPVKVEPVVHSRPMFAPTYNPSVANFAVREIPVHMSNIYTCPVNGVNLNVTDNVAQEVVSRTKPMQSTPVRVDQETGDELVHIDNIKKSNLEGKAQIAEIKPKPRISTKLSPTIEIKNSTLGDTRSIYLEESFSSTEKSTGTFIPSDLTTECNENAYKELAPTAQSLSISSILGFDISNDEEAIHADGKEEITCKSQGSIEVYPEIDFKEDDGQLPLVKEVTDSCLLADISGNWHENSYSNVQALSSQLSTLFTPTVKRSRDQSPKILSQELLGFSSQMEIDYKTFLEVVETGGSNDKKEITSNKETESSVSAHESLASPKLPLTVASKVKQNKCRTAKSQYIVEDVPDEKTADLDIKHTEAKDNIDINKITVSPTPITVVSRVTRNRGKNSKSEDTADLIDEDNNLDSLNDQRNSDVTVKSPNSAIKRKKDRPAKLHIYRSDTSDEEIGNYEIETLRTVSKEFMSGEESSSETQNTNSDLPCIESELSKETCTQNSQNINVFNCDVNITNSSIIDPETQTSTDWSANLVIKRDALYDDSKLKHISNRFDHVPYIYTCHLNGINLNRVKNITEGKLLNIAESATNEKSAALNGKNIEAKDNIDVSELTSPKSSKVPTVRRWAGRISKVQDKTELIDNDNDLDSLKHKRNSNTAVKCVTPVVKRKRGRPPKIKTVVPVETDASDRSSEEVCKYVAKNKRIISKEFITDDESDSDGQQSVDVRKMSVLSEKNADSDQDCIKSELTIENCLPHNEGVNETDSSTIDPETQPPTCWSENLMINQDTLCDNTELNQFSKNNFEHFKTKYKEKVKKVAKQRSPQDKLSQTLLDVPKDPVEEDFRGFDNSEKEAANSLRLTVFRQNIKLVRQICEKSDELNSVYSSKNVQINDNKINIVQDILITKKNAIDLISGTTVANSQRPRFRKSIPLNMNVSVDIISQVMEEMTKTGPAQKARKMFVQPASIYTSAVYSTPAKQKAEEVEEVREKSFDGDELYEDCPRSPDEVVIPDQAPKLIPTQKPQPMRVHKVASTINKLLSFGHETALVDEVAMQFAFQTNYFIAQVVVSKISQNCDKPDNSFPPGPPMSSVQRILLGFLIKLEKSTHPGIFDKVLELIEPQVFNRLVCTIENAQQLTRFYTAICRMRQNLHRMRRFICDSFYFSGDFAVPVLFTALTMWPNILPMASQLSEFPLAKVIVHICYLKLCNKPGYNLMPLRDLLSRFYGYPTERWNCDELFQEILIDYIRNPSLKLSDYTLQLFLKNKPASWVSKKVHDCLIPLYQKVPQTNPNLKATLLILYGNIHYFFKAQELQFVTQIDEWFEGLQQEEKDPVVQSSLIVARQRLLKCRIGSTRKRNKESEPNKALQVIEANVDNSKVQ